MAGVGFSDFPDDMLVRLDNKFTVSDGCWEWTGARSAGGLGGGGFYGRVRWGRSMFYAHRVMYEIFVGSIPRGLQIDHLCRNRVCVRPDHLEPVTQTENQRRRHLAKTMQ